MNKNQAFDFTNDAAHTKSFLGITPATWAALALAVMALILRLWRINYGLPVLYNVDEGFIVPKVVRFGSGDFNPHIFMWPHLFFYFLFFLYGCFFAVGNVIGIFASLDEFKYLYFNDPSAFYIIGRTASAIAGAASVFVLYHIGKRYHSKEAGLAAAVFLTVCHYHFTYSRLSVPEVTMTLLVLVVAYNALRIYEEGLFKNYLFAAIFGGLAVSTKYNAFLIFLSVTLAHFFFIQRQFGWKKLHLRLGRLLLVGGLSLVVFFLGTPYALLDHQTFLKDIAYTTLAASHQDLPRSFGAALVDYIRFFFFPEGSLRFGDFTGVFVIAGVILALVRRRGKDVLLLSYAIPHFLFFTDKTQGYSMPHYLMPTLPFFMLFGGVFCSAAVKWVFSKISSPSPHVVSRAVAGIALVFALPLAFIIIQYDLRSEADTTNLAREWIETNIPAGSRILYTDYHDLRLKPDIQSVIERYDWDRANGISDEAIEQKLKAIENYGRPTYHLEYLYKGWNDEARASVHQMNYQPTGVIPFDYNKFSLDYWREREFQYAIVFRSAIEPFLIGKDAEKFPALREFYTELLKGATVIKEFTPDRPRITGFHIQILKLNRNESK